MELEENLIVKLTRMKMQLALSRYRLYSKLNDVFIEITIIWSLERKILSSVLQSCQTEDFAGYVMDDEK